MPTEPQAGSKTVPLLCSMICTISRTTERGGEELSALLSLGHSKLAKKVFINLPEHIAGGVIGNIGKVLEELFGNAAIFRFSHEAEIFILGKGVFEFRFVLFYQL